MAIKNYTSKVDVYTSIGEIQGELARHGARKIMVDYNAEGRPTSVTFAIDTPSGMRGFVLPANIEGVLAVFKRQKIQENREQAERTGWRNVRDWVMAQTAIIESGMVSVEEVFLPYMVAGHGHGNTLYELYSQGRLALPEAIE
jgi:hypothetical protein